MGGPCRLVSAGAAVEARWRRDGDVLLLSPAGQPPLAVPLERVSGIAGDGHTLRLRLPEGDLSLERLGADGPTLLSELRRDWPRLRARALRLDGGEAPGELFTGAVASAGPRGQFRGFLAGSRVLLAVDGGDVVPLFVADFASVAPSAADSALRCTGWDGGETAFGRLGPKLDAFAAAVVAARERLAREAVETLAGSLPTLGPAGCAALAASWLPGRLLSFERLEQAAPGFGAAFTGSWLPGLPRAAQGESLTAGVPPALRLLGYADAMIWLLVRRTDAWHLELLSEGDYATYLFDGGDDVPGFVEGITRLPQFSREALYLPLEELVRERSAYAIPAQELPLLRELRARFKGRAIHRG